MGEDGFDLLVFARKRQGNAAALAASQDENLAPEPFYSVVYSVETITYQILEGEKPVRSRTLAVPPEVHADHVESTPRKPVQELLVEQRVGHGSRQKDHTRRAVLFSPHGQRDGHARGLDQGLFVRFRPLEGVRQPLRFSPHRWHS